MIWRAEYHSGELDSIFASITELLYDARQVT